MMRLPWRLGRKAEDRTAPGNSGYESACTFASRVVPGVTFTVARMSFGRRVELMRRIRELAGKAEFLSAGQSPEDKMDAALVQAEIERVYVAWGVKAVSGLVIDGREAGPEMLSEAGPEGLFREALAAVRAETGLNEEERKNC